MHTSEIQYQKPVLDNFTAEAKLKDRDCLTQFFNELESKGKSRLEINVNVVSGNELKAAFKGNLVAVLKVKNAG
jgi:thioesterase domain-containing protein